MEIDIRPVTHEQLSSIAELDGAAFGESWMAEQLDDQRPLLNTIRFLGAYDGDRLIGVTGEYHFTMTLPGGAAVAVPGVTWVSVEVTHRRRGVLTALLARQLDGHQREGFPAAVLTASEGDIYGRFGFGPASRVRRTVVDRTRVTLSRPGEPAAVRRVGAAQARRELPSLHERWCRNRPGALRRSAERWDLLCLDRPWQRQGMSQQHTLVHEDGYVTYRIQPDWTDGDPRHTCRIIDYAILSERAHRDLWATLLAQDLVATIESDRIPLDDPLEHAVSGARFVRTTNIGDGLWLRPLDVCALLAARRYAVEVDVVLDVEDSRCGGRWRLTGGPDGASCVPSSSPADVAMDAAGLGVLSLGGQRLAPLVAAGRVRCDDPALIRRVDRALLADVEPSHGTPF